MYTIMYSYKLRQQVGKPNFVGTNGKVSYSSVSPGYYKLIIVAKNSNYDTMVTTRRLTVPDTSYSCAVNLINDGFYLSGSSVTIQFTNVGDVSGSACYFNQQVYNTDCE